MGLIYHFGTCDLSGKRGREQTGEMRFRACNGLLNYSSEIEFSFKKWIYKIAY